jgi:type I restriction enzyme M protein
LAFAALLCELVAMLTDTALRSKVDALWDKLWFGVLSNPLDAIEQLSFLFFLKRLDERQQDAERAGPWDGLVLFRRLRGGPSLDITHLLSFESKAL